MTSLLSEEERFGRAHTMLSCCQSVAPFPQGRKAGWETLTTPKSQCMTQYKPSVGKENIHTAGCTQEEKSVQSKTQSQQPDF